jgi:hypothetical protein
MLFHDMLFHLTLLKTRDITIAPNFNWPGVGLILKLVGSGLGALIIFMMVKFFEGASKIPDRLEQGTVSLSAWKMGGSILVIALTFIGFSLIWGWVHFLGV